MALRTLTTEEISDRGLQPTQEGVVGSRPEKVENTKDILGTFSGVLDTVFGGGVIGEAIGTQLAKRGIVGDLSEEEREFVSEGPSGKAIAGDVLRAGALFTPVGKVAGLATKGTRPLLGLFGSKAAQTGFRAGTARLAGQSVAGGTTGLAFDVGEGLRRDEEITPIAGATGALLPPFVKGAGAALKTLGVVSRELAGVSTGAGGKSIREAFQSAKEGGERHKAFLNSMRGNITEEALVNDTKLALDKVVQRRNREYLANFKTVTDSKQQLNIKPILDELNTNLKNFQIKVVNGRLDFSRSPLRFNPKAKDEVQLIFDELKDFGTQKGDRSAVGLDSLKRAFGDIFSESSQARAFVGNMTKATLKVLNDVKGYSKLESDYAKSTGLIKELSRSLSLNDKATTDTTLKKLLSALRQQKTFREELVQQLDEEAGQFISAQVSGQLLNEVLPSGILRAFGPIGASLGGVVAGGAAGIGPGILTLLSGLSLTSPRLIGEVVNLLGLTARQKDVFINALIKLAPRGARTPGDVLFGPRTAPLGKGAIPRKLSPLAQEAQKFKTAEEFVDAKFFTHGSRAKFDVFDTAKFQTGEGMGGAGRGASFTNRLAVAKQYASKYGEGTDPYLYLTRREGLNIMKVDAFRRDTKLWLKIADTLDKDFPKTEGLGNKIRKAIKDKKFNQLQEELEYPLHWDVHDIFDDVMEKVGVDGLSFLDGTFRGSNTGVTIFKPEKLKLTRIRADQLTDFFNQVKTQ